MVEGVGLLTVGVIGFTSAEILERATADSRPKTKTTDEGFPDAAAHESAPAGPFMIVVIAVAFVRAKPRWDKRIGWCRASNEAAVGRAEAEGSRDECCRRL